ncbi:uncharacterized protein LOC108605638 [Drosophila busckii]|nr:uncharacterized protein LOC108605638 [Drosophila busckii]
MLRIKQGANVDPIELRAKDEVRASLIVFAVIVASIRIIPAIIRKISG